jgi:hypothetical protein
VALRPGFRQVCLVATLPGGAILPVQLWGYSLEEFLHEIGVAYMIRQVTKLHSRMQSLASTAKLTPSADIIVSMVLEAPIREWIPDHRTNIVTSTVLSAGLELLPGP